MDPDMVRNEMRVWVLLSVVVFPFLIIWPRVEEVEAELQPETGGRMAYYRFRPSLKSRWLRSHILTQELTFMQPDCYWTKKRLN